MPETRSAAAPPPTGNAVQQRLQELWAVVDATFGSQPLPQELRNGLFNSLRLIESARAGHPGFGAGLDLDGITRMLLHLAPDAPVDAARHYDALSLASSAHRRGRAGSLDALAAYGLTRQGYPQQSLLSGDDGAPHGRNWSGRPGIRLNTDVAADSRGVHPASWGPAAHATVAERNDEGVVLADGRPVSDEEFAELVRHDPQRQPGAPVVILIGEEDGRNEALARVIADRTGTRVWFTYGRLLLEAAPDGRRVPVLAAPAFGSDPAGTWIPADPGLVPDDPAATVRAANGTLRQWLARQVAQEDLPGSPPGLTGADTVTLAELRDAGIEITTGMDVEAQLGGGVRGSGLAPLDQVRLLLARPGPWPEGLDAVAEAVARKRWRGGSGGRRSRNFDGAVPDTDAVRAWDTALGPVLPGGRPPRSRTGGMPGRGSVTRCAGSPSFWLSGLTPARSRASPRGSGRASDCRPRGRKMPMPGRRNSRTHASISMTPAVCPRRPVCPPCRRQRVMRCFLPPRRKRTAA
ncbi:hypothetical protein ACH4ZX_01745 [Streptomyces sp. NPDC020490]|uniref:hypothetical protein n=1 Tax=Streptomyces sp. NPDC020490 TaxID=3365078 RepID=UPI0037ADCB05